MSYGLDVVVISSIAQSRAGCPVLGQTTIDPRLGDITGHVLNRSGTVHVLTPQVKRKEAIYRQMLEYRRMHTQEQRRANELEAQTKVLEASMQAVEICWSQLVSAIQDLAGQADLGAEVASDEREYCKLPLVSILAVRLGL